jgi:hypothetical protein
MRRLHSPTQVIDRGEVYDLIDWVENWGCRYIAGRFADAGEGGEHGMGGPVEEVHGGSSHRSWTCWAVGLGPLYMQAETAVAVTVVHMALPLTEMHVLKGRSNEAEM